MYTMEVENMTNEDYKKQIIEMVEKMQDQSELRRLYLILAVIAGETE